MNDYHQIRCASRQLTPEYLFDLNSESRLWLAHELDEPFAGKTVVVTHHAPTMRSWPHSGESNYRGSYCNQLDDFISGVVIDFWFHGHVHASVDYEHQQTRVACNPRGYTGYQHVEGFSMAKTVDI